MALLAGSLPPGSKYATPQELLDLFAQNLSVPVSDSSVFVTSPSAPTDVTKIWLDSSGANPVIKVYIGGAWTSISSSSNLSSGLSVTGGNVSILSPVLSIASTGSYANRVGINTTTPAQTLDVAGTINSSNGITTGGTLVVSGATTLASTLAITGNTTITGDLAVNGGDITSGSATANIYNVTSTTVNLGNAATAITLGAPTGTTTVRNSAQVNGTLSVTGTSTFTGNITANGDLSVSGSVTLGSADDDNIVFNGEVSSHIIPNTDDLHDLGSSTKKWRNAYVNGIGYIDSLQILDTAPSTTSSNGAVTVAGGVGIAGAVNVGQTLGVTGATTLSTLSITGNVAVNTNKFTISASSGNTAIAGDLSVSGKTSLGNVDSLFLVDQDVQNSATTGNAATLPSKPVGYLRLQINGTWRRLPFYADS